MTTESQNGITHIAAGERQTIAIGPGLTIVKLGSAHTNGAMTLVEGIFPPGAASVPLHMHPEAETFYALDGEVDFSGVGDDSRPYTFRVRPGDVVHVPPRTPHQFAVAGAAPARGIVIVQPGGFERYLAELAAARRPDGSADIGALRAIGARYGVTYVDLPDR